MKSGFTELKTNFALAQIVFERQSQRVEILSQEYSTNSSWNKKSKSNPLTKNISKNKFNTNEDKVDNRKKLLSCLKLIGKKNCPINIQLFFLFRGFNHHLLLYAFLKDWITVVFPQKCIYYDSIVMIQYTLTDDNDHCEISRILKYFFLKSTFWKYSSIQWPTTSKKNL